MLIIEFNNKKEFDNKKIAMPWNTSLHQLNHLIGQVLFNSSQVGIIIKNENTIKIDYKVTFPYKEKPDVLVKDLLAEEEWFAGKAFFLDIHVPRPVWDCPLECSVCIRLDKVKLIEERKKLIEAYKLLLYFILRHDIPIPNELIELILQLAKPELTSDRHITKLLTIIKTPQASPLFFKPAVTNNENRFDSLVNAALVVGGTAVAVGVAANQCSLF